MRHSLYLALVLLIAVPNIANSCAFHINGEVGSESLYLPGSTQILMNTVYRQNQGELSSISHLEGIAGYQRVSWWMQLFSSQLQNYIAEPTPILIVDIAMWAQYQPDIHPRVVLDTGRPKDVSNTIMLTQAALSAIVLEEISFSDARTIGILNIHQRN